MMKRCYGRPGILLIMIPFIFLILSVFACARPDHPGGPLVGGPCKYKSYPGQATILSIAHSQTSLQTAIELLDVQFIFKPIDRIEESFVQGANRTFNLYGKNFQYPDREFLRRHNLRVGSVLNGSMEVIVSGTCTPVLFDFPDLKR